MRFVTNDTKVCGNGTTVGYGVWVTKSETHNLKFNLKEPSLNNIWIRSSTNAEEFHLESGKNFSDSDQSYETSEDELENVYQ